MRTNTIQNNKYIDFSQVQENQRMMANIKFAEVLDRNIRNSLGTKAYVEFQQIFTQDYKSLAVQL